MNKLFWHHTHLRSIQMIWVTLGALALLGLTAFPVSAHSTGAALTTAHPAGSAKMPAVPSCTFQTLTDYYLTAVGGGGGTTDVIHTDARIARSWERFDLIYQNSDLVPGKRDISQSFAACKRAFVSCKQRGDT